MNAHAPAPLQRARGTARLVARRLDDGRTGLVSLYQEGAGKIRLPNTYDPSLQGVLINTAGGMTGGDRFNWRAEAGAGTHLVLTTPACERIYRSLGEDATVETYLTVGSGARLDWLPQETILYEGSRFRRRLDIDLAADATLLAVESFLIGREAMGETAPNASFADSWRVRRGGRLVHAEETRLSADPLERGSLSLLAGNLAFATILYVADDAERRLEGVRAIATPQIGSSALGERLIIRALAPSGLALRRAIVPIIGLLSHARSLPRLWHM